VLCFLCGDQETPVSSLCLPASVYFTRSETILANPDRRFFSKAGLVRGLLSGRSGVV
jgi:hypothetical protein